MNCSARLKTESKGRRAEEANVFVRIKHKSKAKFGQRLPVGKPDWMYPHSFMPPPPPPPPNLGDSPTEL